MKKHIQSIITIMLVICMILGITNYQTRVLADDNKQYIGTVTKTGKDNGYSGSNEIDIDDPHYGWELGRFYLKGYTQSTKDSDNAPVFLKNVGDKVELRFELFQDIDCLNGDENLTIYADSNGYDQYFGTQKFNDCRGLLIIRKTDYTNSAGNPVIYSNYLDGAKKGADTSVELCEEGDYEVALDYEIQEKEYGVDWNSFVSVPFYTNYRISFTFKVRNGNCMVFPFDSSTGSELTNEAITENGFYLDLAMSRYLDINVEKSVYTEGANGYTKDVRFNRPASDGTKYEEEGIYTITVKNHFTNAETQKTIYVGKDPIMKAFVISGYTPDEIKDLLKEGYSISDDGQLIEPENFEAVQHNDIADNEEEEDEADDDESVSDKKSTKKKSEKKNSSNATSTIGTIFAVITTLFIIVAVIVAVIIFKKKKAIAQANASLPKKENTSESNASNNQVLIDDNSVEIERDAESEEINNTEATVEKEGEETTPSDSDDSEDELS